MNKQKQKQFKLDGTALEDAEAGLLNKSLCLAAALGVTKIITIIVTYWVTLFVLLKSDLDVQRIHLRGRFVEQKLMVSSSFRCYQIHNCHRLDFGHTLLCYLSRTQMFKNPLFVQSQNQYFVTDFSALYIVQIVGN